MTVSFKSSLTDTWHQISYLTTKTIVGRCFLVLLLFLPFVGPSVALYHAKPGSKAEHLMSLFFWPGVGLTYLVLIVAITLGLFLGTAITPTITVKIDQKFCHIKNFTRNKVPWRRVAKLVEEPDYLCFIGWTLSCCIPKLAFNNRAEADNFYQTALQYWREAKGLPTPPLPAVSDTAGVWPPAPRPSNSAEPGDSL